MDFGKGTTSPISRNRFPIPSFLGNSAMSASDSEPNPRSSGSGFIPKQIKNKHKEVSEVKEGLSVTIAGRFPSSGQLPETNSEFRRHKNIKQVQPRTPDGGRELERVKARHDLKLKESASTKGLRQTSWTVTPSPKNSEQTCSKLKEFKILKKLGSGQFGDVFLAVHARTGFIGALKQIRKTNLLKGDPELDLKAINQLTRQIKLQFFLNHPNLIAIYDFFDQGQCLYLFMELACDGELYSLYSKGHIFTDETTSIVIREITQGIDYMHSLRILHRDIKLENIVLSLGMAKLCDFGWAVYCPKEFRSTLCGTPLYLSPQILAGQQYNKKVDSWAIGSIAHELVTGHDPFQIKHAEDLSKVITEDFQMKEGSPELRSFITFILRKNPGKRPDTATILMHPFIEKFKEMETSDELIRLIQHHL